MPVRDLAFPPGSLPAPRPLPCDLPQGPSHPGQGLVPPAAEQGVRENWGRWGLR